MNETTIKEKDSFSEGNIFCTERHFPISTSQKALKNYTDKLEKALNLDGDIPIIFDTNVLLDYYRISFSEREELEKFFEQNKHRIYLTKQVEEEFLKHRIDHIRSYLKSLDDFVNSYKNIKEEIERLKNGEIKGFDHYVERNIILKNDYQDLRNELSTFNETIKEKLKNLFSESGFEEEIIEKERKIEEIRKRLEGQADIERNDPLLNIISNFKTIDELDLTEKEFLKSKYDSLKSKYDEVKNDQNCNWKHTFPGCGEKKENPYGDFIIYHEIIKFLKNSKTDAVFLTNDVEKNDWLYRKKTDLIPYTHYIINSYSLSNQTLFILSAKDKLRVSYSPVYTEQESIEEDIIAASNSNETQSKSNILGDKIKIIDKIDLSDFNSRRLNIFDGISKEEFLRELEESEKWADNYGSGFVGLNSFIYKYLGVKGYDYQTSFEVKEELEEEGKIATYIHKPKNSFYNEVEAIKIKD
ncbi:MAG: PIN domain-containing protein [Allomuricauda sp.]